MAFLAMRAAGLWKSEPRAGHSDNSSMQQVHRWHLTGHDRIFAIGIVAECTRFPKAHASEAGANDEDAKSRAQWGSLACKRGAPQVHECKLPFRLHEIVPNMTHESESFSNLRQRSAEMQHFHRWSPRRKPSPEFDLGSRVANDSSSLPARVGFFKWVTGLLAVSVSRQSSRKYSELCWGWGDSASSALRPHSHC